MSKFIDMHVPYSNVLYCIFISTLIFSHPNLQQMNRLLPQRMNLQLRIQPLKARQRYVSLMCTSLIKLLHMDQTHISFCNIFHEKEPTPIPTTANQTTLKPTDNPTTANPTTLQPTSKPTTKLYCGTCTSSSTMIPSVDCKGFYYCNYGKVGQLYDVGAGHYSIQV